MPATAPGKPSWTMQEATWDRTLGLNLRALAMVCSAAGRVMARPTTRPHRQHHLAGLAHGAAELHRLCREQGRRRRRSRAPPRSALAPYGVLVNSRRARHDGHARCSARPRPSSRALEGRDDLQAFLDERTRRVPLGRRARRSRGRRRRRLARARRARLHHRRAPQRLAAASTRTEPMARVNRPPDAPRPRALASDARRACAATCSTWPAATAQGYIGQGLGIADLLAALYFHELRYDPADLDLAGAATASCSRPATTRSRSGRRSPKAGIIPVDELVDLRRRRQPARHVARSTRRRASR